MKKQNLKELIRLKGIVKKSFDISLFVSRFFLVVFHLIFLSRYHRPF